MAFSLTDLQINYESDFVYRQYQIPQQEESVIHESIKLIREGSGYAIKRILQLCKKHPNNPVLLNNLAVAFLNSEDYENAERTLKDLIEKFPEYVLGWLSLAHFYITSDHDPSIVTEFIGEEMDLQKSFPHRDGFHIDEVLRFLNVAVQYYYRTGDPEAAGVYLEMLEELDPDAPLTQQARFSQMMNNLKEGIKREIELREEGRHVISRDYDKSVQTDEPPQFAHSEIFALYENDYSIGLATIEQILSLPRDTLIRDLETVIEDSIRRYEYFHAMTEKHGWNEQTMNFPLHALLILAELRAESSLNTILRLLRQGEDLLRFWFADLVSELFWEIIYHTGKHKLHALKHYMMEPGNFTFARVAVSTAVGQLGLNNSSRLAEIAGWYGELFDFFLNHPDHEEIIDTDVISFMVGDCKDLQLSVLRPKIRRLFEMGWVNPAINGGPDKIEKGLAGNPDFKPIKYRLRSIFDHYAELQRMQSDFYDAQFPNDLPELDFEPFKNKLSEAPKNPKTGRNEPCPCGSGKKFKKCCMK